MFGFGGAVCPPRSPCDRTSGSAGCPGVSPFFRYDTWTFAFELSSPSTRHSKPSDTSVGGSVQNAPGRVMFEATVVCACADCAHANAPAIASTDKILRMRDDNTARAAVLLLLGCLALAAP